MSAFLLRYGTSAPGNNPQTNRYKFNPGDYALTVQYHSSIAEAQLQIRTAALQTQGITPAAAGIQGYAWQLRWGDFERATTNDNLISDAVNGVGQYAQFQQIAQVFNYLQTWIPGARMILYVNGGQFWQAPGPSYTLGSGTPVPGYILNCGGNLSVPNSFGSSSSTNYTLGVQPNGQCGYGLSPFYTPNYQFIYPALWDPAVNQCWINFWQALSMFKFPITAGPLAGQTLTLDANPLFESVINNDEYSYQFTQGPFNAPAATGSANQATAANNWNRYLTWMTAATQAFPHTMVGTCLSYVFQGVTFQSPDDWLTMLPQLFAIPGSAFSDSDTYAGDWVNGYAHAAQAKLAYRGITPSSVSDGMNPIPAPSHPIYQGINPNFSQYQNYDYDEHKSLPPGVTAQTASIITAGCQSANTIGSSHRLWSIQDSNFNYTAYQSYIQPTFSGPSGQVTYPVNAVRPTALP